MPKAVQGSRIAVGDPETAVKPARSRSMMRAAGLSAACTRLVPQSTMDAANSKVHNTPDIGIRIRQEPPTVEDTVSSQLAIPTIDPETAHPPPGGTGPLVMSSSSSTWHTTPHLSAGVWRYPQPATWQFEMGLQLFPELPLAERMREIASMPLSDAQVAAAAAAAAAEEEAIAVAAAAEDTAAEEEEARRQQML